MSDRERDSEPQETRTESSRDADAKLSQQAASDASRLRAEIAVLSAIKRHGVYFPGDR